MAKFNMKGKKKQFQQKGKKGSKKESPKPKKFVNKQKNVQKKNFKKKAQVKEESTESESDEIDFVNDKEDDSDELEINNAPQMDSSDDMEDDDSKDKVEQEDSDDDENSQMQSLGHGDVEDDEDDEDDEEEEEESEEEKPLPSKNVKQTNVKPNKPNKTQNQTNTNQNDNTQNQGGFDKKNDQDFPPSSRIYVRNLPYGVTGDSLTNFFESKSLNVVDVFVSSAKPNNLFAFVEFKTLDQARTAVSLNGTDFDGSALEIAFSKPRNRESQQSDESKILFVKNLGTSVTKDELEDHFGKVQEVRIMLNPDGSCRGHAYVEFFTAKDAIDAKERLAGSSINGTQIFIDFAKPRNNQSFSNDRGSKFQGRGGGRGGNFRGNRGGRGNFGGNRGFVEKGKNRFFKGDNDEKGGKFAFGGRGRGNKFRGGQNQKITFDDD